MKKIGLVYHPLNNRALKQAQRIQEVIEKQGVSTWICSAWDPPALKNELSDTDLIITAGGDGTILRAAQVVADYNVPITGINLGRLGFMTELSTSEAETEVPRLLDGEGWLDERSLLETEIDQPSHSTDHICHFHALNDVVVARGGIARIIGIDASIDDTHVASYKADGAIVSTATGSTGYALAAGGPIMHPQATDYLLVPIVPHVSFHYPLLVPRQSVVKLKVFANNPATMSIDGHISMPLINETVVTVRASTKTVSFLRLKPKSDFFARLEHKIKG